MNIHTVAKILYGFFGIAFLFIGLSLAMYSTGIVPQGTQDILLHAAGNNQYALHLFQEFGALLVFAALISFWFIKNYEQSMGFHWAMTLFWTFMAFIHWIDVRDMKPSLLGSAINTIPLVLFVVVGVWRRKR